MPLKFLLARLASVAAALVLGAGVLLSAEGEARSPRRQVESPSVLSGFRDCSDCPQMVRISGGTFEMGDESGSGNADEKPVHTVTIGSFAMGKYEVTRGEYAAFVRDSGRPPNGDCYTANSAGAWEKQASATWQSPGFSQSERDPVVCVSWEDAKAYVEWLSEKTGQTYRLPSEAEWEYAARGGSQGKFWWGASDNDACRYANGADQTAKQKFPSWASSSCNDGQLYTAPVGSYPANKFGLHDTSGNAWEWVEDCYESTYGLQPRDGRGDASGTCTVRVLRGGSWYRDPKALRSAHRGSYTSTVRYSTFGFRVARAM